MLIILLGLSVTAGYLYLNPFKNKSIAEVSGGQKKPYIASLVNNFFNRFIPADESNKTVSASPVPILKGKETYTISQGSKNNPRILSAVIDPLDPEPKQSQTIDIALKYEEPIDSATITLNTDNDSVQKTLKLSSGSKTDGIWSTTFKSSDTHLYNYSFTINASSGSDSSSVDITVR